MSLDKIFSMFSGGKFSSACFFLETNLIPEVIIYICALMSGVLCNQPTSYIYNLGPASLGHYSTLEYYSIYPGAACQTSRQRSV